MKHKISILLLTDYKEFYTKFKFEYSYLDIILILFILKLFQNISKLVLIIFKLRYKYSNIIFCFRKAPVPLFSKDENTPEVENADLDIVPKEEIQYSEKFKPLREDPNYIKMKEKQRKAEMALKEWKKQKLEVHKRSRSKNANRNNKAGKNTSFHQTGKAIVFQ